MHKDGSTKKIANLADEELARALGWFSIGIGLAEVLAPNALSRLIGTPRHTGLMRAMGLREFISGIGILIQPNPTLWLRARVGGDAIDLALLGASFAHPEACRGRLALATSAAAGITALDVLCSRRLAQNPNANVSAIRVKDWITINRPAEDIYRFWRDFQNLPRFMRHLRSVRVLDDKRSHWEAKGPAGSTVDWDAEIVDDKPNGLIAWRSVPGSTVQNAGSVRFQPATGGRGTIVRVDFVFESPAGALGAAVAALFGQSPKKHVKIDLLRFKQVLETGEIARTEGQPAGRARSTSRKYDDLVRA